MGPWQRVQGFLVAEPRLRVGESGPREEERHLAQRGPRRLNEGAAFSGPFPMDLLLFSLRS